MEFCDVDVAEGRGSAELMCGEADLGEVLDGFGLHEGVGQGGAVGQQAVVGQQDGVVVGDEGFEAGADFFGSGGGVGGQGDEAGGHEDLGADGLIEGFAAGCEGSCDGWVGVDDGLHVGAHAVDGEMHADLAGDVAGSGELVAVVVDENHVGGVQEAFAAAGGRGEDEVFVESNGEVARGAWGVAEAVDPSAEADELPAKVHLGGMERRFEISACRREWSAASCIESLDRGPLVLWGSESFLTFRPTTSEALKR